MSTWYKFNKVMSIIVLSLSIILCITLAVIFFIASNSIRGVGGVYVWYGIIMLLVGIPFSIGVFAAWNMLTDWYAKSTLGKALPVAPPVQYGVPMQQYTYPQPAQPAQANMWNCPYCGTANDITSGFCCNCGKPKQ